MFLSFTKKFEPRAYVLPDSCASRAKGGGNNGSFGLIGEDRREGDFGQECFKERVCSRIHLCASCSSFSGVRNKRGGCDGCVLPPSIERGPIFLPRENNWASGRRYVVCVDVTPVFLSIMVPSIIYEGLRSCAERALSASQVTSFEEKYLRVLSNPLNQRCICMLGDDTSARSRRSIHWVDYIYEL